METLYYGTQIIGARTPVHMEGDGKDKKLVIVKYFYEIVIILRLEYLLNCIRWNVVLHSTRMLYHFCLHTDNDCIIYIYN